MKPIFINVMVEGPNILSAMYLFSLMTMIGIFIFMFITWELPGEYLGRGLVVIITYMMIYSQYIVG